MKINNLAHLKKVLQPGSKLRVIQHTKHDITGLIREVSVRQSNAVYTRIAGQPDHHFSKCNGGRGLRMNFEKSPYYLFGDTVKVFNSPGDENSLIYEFEVLEAGKEEAA